MWLCEICRVSISLEIALVKASLADEESETQVGLNELGLFLQPDLL